MRTVFSEERVTLPIIMYHSILKDGARQGKYVVSPEVLARDLDALRARGCETVTGTRPHRVHKGWRAGSRQSRSC